MAARCTHETVLIAYREARRADPERRPTALRIHPEDWYSLLAEVTRNFAPVDGGKRYMGMVPLIDPKWPRLFPSCLNPKGAADAIEAGARAWGI